MPGFLNTHQGGIVALVLLLAVALTPTGGLILPPTVFILGFVPAFLCESEVLGVLRCEDIEERSCSDRSLVPVVLVVASLALGVIAGVVMLRLLFALTIFTMTAVSGVVLAAIMHMLLQDSGGAEGVMFAIEILIMFAIEIAAGLLSGPCRWRTQML